MSASADHFRITHAHYMPLVGVGKERRIKNGYMVKPEKAAPVSYWNYLGDYWPSASGLSAVNAIGRQLRDPINSGLTRRRLTV